MRMLRAILGPLAAATIVAVIGGWIAGWQRGSIKLWQAHKGPRSYYFFTDGRVLTIHMSYALRPAEQGPLDQEIDLYVFRWERTVLSWGGTVPWRPYETVERHFQVSSWLPFSLAGTYLIFIMLRGRRRSRSGHCRVCGYDLTGNLSGVCSECGNPIQPSQP